MENTVTVSKNTLKKRRQRDNIRKDPERLAAYREKEKERLRDYRSRKKQELEGHPRLLSQNKEKKRLQMSQYRKKLKEKKIQEEAVEGRRRHAAAEREEQKRRDQEKAEKLIKVQEKTLKKHKEVLRVQRYRLRVKLRSPDSSTSTSTSSPFSSSSTERRSVRQAKKSLPQTPSKRALVIEKMAQSPSCRDILEERGIISAKSSRKKLMMQEAIVESVQNEISQVKPTGGMSTERRRAYAGLRQIVLSAKLKSKLTKSMKIRQAAQKNEKWWLLQRKQRKDCISDQIKKDVQDFYLSPGISREVPEKRAVVKLKSGQLSQRYNMVMTLREAHEIFKKVYPQKRIGLTKFKKLRPIQVKRVLETTRRTCLCQKCCNSALKTEALKKFITTTKMKLNNEVAATKHDIINLTMCAYDGPYGKNECIHRQCQNCGVSRLSEHYEEVKKMPGKIQWHVWEYVPIEKNGQQKRVISCVTKETTLPEFFEAYEKDVAELSSHIFRSEWQLDQMKMCIKAHPTMVMDFAENYSCHYQNEIQSGFFDKVQVILHPMMLYYSINGINTKHAIIGIAEETTKDVDTVRAFETAAIEQFQKAGVELQEIHQFSDGCAAQYKGKRSFYDISQRTHPRIVRNFFETSHGKSVCDGLGAIIKNSFCQAVLSGKTIIPDAKSLYDYCEKKLTSEKKWEEDGVTCVSKREFFYLELSQINKDHTDVKTVPGTRQFHAVRGVGKDQTIESRTLSCYCHGCNTQSPCSNASYVPAWEKKSIQLLEKTCEISSTHSGKKTPSTSKSSKTRSKARSRHIDDMDEDLQDIEPGDFAAVKLTGRSRKNQAFQIYMAEVLEEANEEGMVVSFMKKMGENYTWPDPPDIALQPREDIICSVAAPSLINERSQFRFKESDFEKIKNCLKSAKRMVFFK